MAKSRGLIVTRFLALLTLGTALLAGCAANHGMTQTRPDARPHAEAHAECWERAMNIAGFGATAAQSQAYEACMARAGWADQRSIR
jgi:outer membrane murein-binding lipoprotein Lpp